MRSTPRTPVAVLQWVSLALALSAMFAPLWPYRGWAGFVGCTMTGLLSLAEHATPRNHFGVGMGLHYVAVGAGFGWMSVLPPQQRWLSDGLLVVIGGSVLGVWAVCRWLLGSRPSSAR